MVKVWKIMKTISNEPPTYFSPSISQVVRDHYVSLFPEEACGVICADPKGHVSYMPLPNVALQDRCRSFEMKKSDVLALCLKSRHQGLKMLAWVHSHPQGKNEASAHDRAFWWAENDWLWPGMDQIVLWPQDAEVLQMSIYGPKTQRYRPLPYWQGPLKRL